VIVMLSETYLVVTDDFPLSNIIVSLGRDAININHLRDWIIRAVSDQIA
jgi:hypothetical protein